MNEKNMRPMESFIPAHWCRAESGSPDPERFRICFETEDGTKISLLLTDANAAHLLGSIAHALSVRANDHRHRSEIKARPCQ